MVPKSIAVTEANDFWVNNNPLPAMQSSSKIISEPEPSINDVIRTEFIKCQFFVCLFSNYKDVCL